MTSSAAEWTELAALDFTPDASASYLVFWSGSFAQTTASSRDLRIRITIDGTAILSANMEPRAITEVMAHAGFVRLQAGASPTASTVAIGFQPENDNYTTIGRAGRLTALRMGNGDAYTEALYEQSTVSTTPQLAITVTVAPVSTVTYIVVASALVSTTTTTTVPVYFRLHNASTSAATNELGAAPAEIASGQENWVPVMLVWRQTLNAGSRTLSLQFRAHTGQTAKIRDARIAVLRADDFDAVHYAELATDSTGSDASFATALDLTATVSGNPLLVLAGWATSCTTNSVDIGTRLTEAGTPLGESVRRSYNQAAIRFQGSALATRRTGHAAGSRTWTIDRRSNGSAVAYLGRSSAIAVLDLGPAAAPAAVTRATVTWIF